MCTVCGCGADGPYVPQHCRCGRYARVFRADDGWKNVRGEDGKPLEFSKASAVKLFTDLPEVYERLQEEAKLSANFRDVALEDEVKN